MSLLIQLDPPLSGAENMLRDQQYYSRFDPEYSQARLRFYTWSEPTLSIGRFQNLKPEMAERLQSLQMPVVRRPTGGAGILHAGDLTFSLVLPAYLLPGSILKTHALIIDALQTGLSAVGLKCQSASQRSAQASETASAQSKKIRQANCFEDLSPADLGVIHAGNIRKLVGTAQVRRRQAVLIQGMFYLQTPSSLLQQVFGESTQTILDLQTLLGYLPEQALIIETLSESFTGVLEYLG